jgi:diaminohydroxyphosphoribosylaminopyrimidine deaminase/5-amino-6-(5-phosphoribosylamino)uracil reductase
MQLDPADLECMVRAIELAGRGQGCVEPNPMVGCVIAREGRKLSEGWHRQFGGPHAESDALASAGDCRGATMYVSLEPCCHRGKTPPCTEAIIAAGLERVVIAQADPFEQVAGGGIGQLKDAGIQVDVGLMEEEARYLNAPYRKLIERGRPWIIAKWAMTLDGKIASRTGHSRWISGEASRSIVHRLRGRVDAIMVGSGTAAADDPQLTARPPGPRVASRLVVDSRAGLSPQSQLVCTAGEIPVLVAVGSEAPPEAVSRLAEAGCEIVTCEGETHRGRVEHLLDELGRRRMTNVLVEGGGRLLGHLFDLGEIDEIHVFMANKLVGGASAPSPCAGEGLAEIPTAPAIRRAHIEVIDSDIYVHGRTAR